MTDAPAAGGDPFDQLRIGEPPSPPDRRFVTGLRHRMVAALDAAGLSTVTLPARSTTTMTDTSTTTRPATTTVSTLKPYLCATPAAAAIDWYVAVLDAVEQVRYTSDDGRIGHAELAIGGAGFMLSDEYPEMGVISPTTLGGTPFAIHLEVPAVDAVHARVVADGRAVVGREPHDEAYGSRSFDMVDPFGFRWMIQTPIATPSIAEIESNMEGFTITAPATTPTSAGPAPVEIGYVTFGSPDTAAAARFYGALFGWQTEPGNLGDQYAHIDNTKLPMGLTPGTPDESAVIYFRVDDVARYTARVGELGGVVVSETTYESGPNAVCRDDQGREFQLWQPAPGYE